MGSHLKYATYIVRHKFYVGQECFKRGLILRGIVHDYDKLFPSRWNAYRNNFSNGTPDKEAQEKYRLSWRRHVTMNDHHWQHWVSVHDNGEVRAHEMTEVARKEMLADWIGAHKAIGGTSLRGWWLERKDTIIMAPKTKRWIDQELIKIEGMN